MPAAAVHSLAEAERAEREAFKQIVDLGRRELEEVKLWIAGACEGDRPKPDANARAILAERLARAVEATEANSRREVARQ